jgi:hypothetical protein
VCFHPGKGDKPNVRAQRDKKEEVIRTKGFQSRNPIWGEEPEAVEEKFVMS